MVKGTPSMGRRHKVVVGDELTMPSVGFARPVVTGVRVASSGTIGK